jgi:hypothetical protein
MFGGFIAAIAFAAWWLPGGRSESIGIAGAAIIGIGGWVAAWTWWSWSVPQWRIWALRNCVDWPALRKQAVAGGLIWPDGWIFEKTELKSAEQRKIELILRRIRETED